MADVKTFEIRETRDVVGSISIGVREVAADGNTNHSFSPRREKSFQLNRETEKTTEWEITQRNEKGER